MDCSLPGSSVLHYILDLLKLTSIELVMLSNHPSHSMSFPSPSALIFHSIRVFSNELVLHIRWPKYWSHLRFSISPSSESSELISFRIDWLDHLAVPGDLKSLLQNHNSKASILRCSAFFMVQLTSIHNYWKNHSLDCRDLGKPLLFSTLSRFVITYLPRSKLLYELIK